MTVNRHLDWDGSCNARDLGGLRTVDGRKTRWGAVVRSETPAHFTAHGWSALWEHGVRTIIDLTGYDEHQPDHAPRPHGLVTVHVPLDDFEDTEFWNRWGGRLSCTPLYYSAFVDRFPQRIALIFGTLARSQPGGVLVHCGGGRDRTGLIVLLLLALVGVAPDDIAADHALSHDRLRPLYARKGLADDAPVIEEVLAGHNTTARETIFAMLSTLDVDGYLRSSGVSDEDLAAVRARLLVDNQP
jgi:protein-tyrosine phosphatase